MSGTSIIAQISMSLSYKETCRTVTTMRITLEWPVILNRSCYFFFLGFAFDSYFKRVIYFILMFFGSRSF